MEDILARDLDENSTWWAMGTRDECEAARQASLWRDGVLARFENGTYCYASKPVWMKRGERR